MITTVARLSVCSCGAPVLKDEFGIGTIYDIDTNRITTAQFVCGCAEGCGKTSSVDAVFVNARKQGDKWVRGLGYLPLDLFDLTPDAITATF